MKCICVGLGARGRYWYCWAQQAGLEVAGVVDLDDETREAVCDELKISQELRFQSIAEATEKVQADVATVCTPNHTHAAAVMGCLDAGLHVLVEKPMVLTIDEARDVITIAKERQLQVAVAQNYRYLTQTLALQKAVQSGMIGQVVTVDVAFMKWRPARDMYLPLLLNQAIHHFDAVRAILGGDPLWCFARSWNPAWSPSEGPTLLQGIWGIDAAETAAANDEVIFSYSGSYVSRGLSRPSSGCWRIEGSTGRLELTDVDVNGEADQRLVLERRLGQERVELAPPPETSGEVAVCRAFVEAVAAGRAAPTEATDNIKSLSMCWAAQRSSDQRRLVDMREFFGADH